MTAAMTSTCSSYCLMSDREEAQRQRLNDGSTDQKESSVHLRNHAVEGDRRVSSALSADKKPSGTHVLWTCRTKLDPSIT